MENEGFGGCYCRHYGYSFSLFSKVYQVNAIGYRIRIGIELAKM